MTAGHTTAFAYLYAKNHGFLFEKIRDFLWLFSIFLRFLVKKHPRAEARG